MSLSVCLIVKNEAGCLANCLNSIRDLADEIIVVDTGSTDRTKEIAAQFTSKIYDFTWCDDFSKARNVCIGKASKEWVLFLDADETISVLDHSLIREAITKDIAGYLFTTRTYTSELTQVSFVSSLGDSYIESRSYKGWLPAQMCRLFRHDGVQFAGRIHESVIPSIQEKGGVIGEIGVPIHHYGALKLDGVKLEKERLYAKLGKLKEREMSDNPKTLFESAKRTIMEKDFVKARELLEEVQDLHPTYPCIYSYLTYVYAHVGLFATAAKAFEVAVQQNEPVRLRIMNMAIAYERQGKFDDAVSLLLQHDFSSFVPYGYLLGKCLHLKGGHTKAVVYLEQVLTQDSTYWNAYHFLINSYVALGQHTDAIAVLEKGIAGGHPSKSEFEKLRKRLQCQ